MPLINNVSLTAKQITHVKNIVFSFKLQTRNTPDTATLSLVIYQFHCGQLTKFFTHLVHSTGHWSHNILHNKMHINYESMNINAHADEFRAGRLRECLRVLLCGHGCETLQSAAVATNIVRSDNSLTIITITMTNTRFKIADHPRMRAFLVTRGHFRSRDKDIEYTNCMMTFCNTNWCSDTHTMNSFATNFN